MNLMVTKNQNSVTDTQKGKESKRNTEGSHQITGEGSKRNRTRKERQPPFQTINTAAVHTHLPTITSEADGRKVPTERHKRG